MTQKMPREEKPQDKKVFPSNENFAGIEIDSSYYDVLDAKNTCMFCQKAKFRTKYRNSRFGFPIKFAQCECGILKQVPMPNKKFFSWFFNAPVFFKAPTLIPNGIWGFFNVFEDNESRLRTGEHRYRLLKRKADLSKSISVMEIGPSTGDFLDVMRSKGHKPNGCDVSLKFIEAAKNQYDLSIDHGCFEDLSYPSESFDLVAFFNVIENVPNPVEFMTEVKRVVSEDGVIVFNFVNMKNNWINKLQGDRYFMWRPPICYAYNKGLIDRLLNNVGFDDVRFFFDIRFMTLEKIFTLLGWMTAYKIVKFFKLEKINIKLYAYPSYLVIARKSRFSKI